MVLSVAFKIRIRFMTEKSISYNSQSNRARFFLCWKVTSVISTAPEKTQGTFRSVNFPSQESRVFNKLIQELKKKKPKPQFEDPFFIKEA